MLRSVITHFLKNKETVIFLNKGVFMKKMFLLLMCLSLSLCFVQNAAACDDCQCEAINFENEFRVIDGKVYLNSENVQIEQDGIILFYNGNTIPLQSLHADAEGIYVKAHELGFTCKNGHPSKCPWCLGCGVLLCQFKCRCH